MENQELYISELSTSIHNFKNYHFCRGNGSKRKSRFGLIEKGEGTYMYLNKKISVKSGDVIFIPEKIFCYSEWHGSPDIKVTYINCYMHYTLGYLEYIPQKLPSTEYVWQTINNILQLLNGDNIEKFEAYSLFYQLLKTFIPNMVRCEIPYDKTLEKIIDYITNHFNSDFSITDVANSCNISTSKLHHLFKANLGITPIQYLNSIKINMAIQYLENNDYSISEISRLVNFKSENHFRKIFFSTTGTNPLKYRKQL